MTSDVTTEGLRGAAPGRQAIVGGASATSDRRGGGAGRGGGGRGEQRQVPPAEFQSYYGQPIVRGPQWATLDIAGYLFLGGLAGASALLALVADGHGDEPLGTRAKVTAAGSAVLSIAALVHDLGRPERFINMLRVVKPTSPMNVGSWLLAAFAPASIVAAGCGLTGRMPRIARSATLVSGALGPLVTSYTAVLLSDTAVPAWHDAADELPFVFVGSSAMAAGGVAMVLAGDSAKGPARLGLLGAAAETTAVEIMRRRKGVARQAYQCGRPGALLRAGTILAIGGAAATLLGRRGEFRHIAGLCLVTASALTRVGVFLAGRVSADDPRFTVEPQRARLEQARHEQDPMTCES